MPQTLPKTWCIHMSNPILTQGNTHVSKPPYISFEVAEFWGVFTLGSPTPHILSCFSCSFSPVRISSNRTLSWRAVTCSHFVFLYYKKRNGWAVAFPEQRPPGRLHWGAVIPTCLPVSWEVPLISLCTSDSVFSDLDSGASYPSMHRAVSQDTFLWFQCEICSRNSHLCQFLGAVILWISHSTSHCQGVRDPTWYPHAATVDFLLLCTLISTVFPPAQGLCEEKYENGAEWPSFSQELQCLHALGFCCLIVWGGH